MRAATGHHPANPAPARIHNQATLNLPSTQHQRKGGGHYSKQSGQLRNGLPRVGPSSEARSRWRSEASSGVAARRTIRRSFQHHGCASRR